MFSASLKIYVDKKADKILCEEIKSIIEGEVNISDII